MATVVGLLYDFGFQALTPYQPQVVFTPSGPGVSGDYGTNLHATKPIAVTPSSTGYFRVDLAPTVAMFPDRWYKVTIQWLDSDGGYIGRDFLDWELRVPEEGGNIGDLLEVPANPAQVWVGEDPPANPTPGTWWLNPTTGDLKEWS